MASIGHVAVGMAAAGRARNTQARWSLFTWMVIWSGLSLLADADVIGFRFGVHYAAPFGHRGATHSFVFALAVAVLCGLIAARALKLDPHAALRIFFSAACVLLSHPLLDTLTDGGLGCALLWPFSYTRYFAPWRPIPVAPIGRAYWSAVGLRVAFTELLLFAPLLLYALWPRRTRRMA